MAETIRPSQSQYFARCSFPVYLHQERSPLDPLLTVLLYFHKDIDSVDVIKQPLPHHCSFLSTSAIRQD